MSEDAPDANAKPWVFGASAILLVITIVLAVFLLGKTMSLSFGSSSRPLGPGSFPAGVLTLILVFAAAIIVQEWRAWKTDKPVSMPGGVSGQALLMQAVISFGLLILLLFVWPLTGFLVAAMALYAILSTMLIPRGAGSAKAYLTALATAIFGTVGIWVLFEKLLSIPLH